MTSRSNPPPARLDDLRAGVRRILRDRLDRTVDRDDTDLIASGLLDSLALAELIMALEEEFALAVDYGALKVDDFRSVDAIVAYLGRHSPSRSQA